MLSFNEQLNILIKNALQEDVGDGDHSALCCIPANAKGKAVLKIKQDGLLAGMDIARRIFHFKEPGATFTEYKKDGPVGPSAYLLRVMQPRLRGDTINVRNG